MKKKIMIFMFLLVFLVGLVVPDQAKAEDVSYTVEDFKTAYNALSDDLKNDLDTYPYVFGVSSKGYISFLVFNNGDVPDSFYYGLSYNNVPSVGYSNVKHDGGYNGYQYSYINGEWKSFAFISFFETDEELSTIKASYFDTFYNRMTSSPYQSILSSPYKTGFPTLDVFLNPSYIFENWCSDAGLNCAASSNETEDLYDFTFNPEDYHYIVRRNRIAGSKYTLYLSQVTKEEDLIYYSSNRALADSKIGAAALYVLSGEYASGSTSICNYVYDSTGGGWLYTDNYGVDLGFTNDYFVDDIGISFSSSMPIVYSSTDIFSDKEQSSVYYAADTEFKDPFVVYPNISPTSTPTPTPISNSGSSDLGGNVVAGGGIDFIISIVSQLWSRVFSIPMYVDGFQINLQQIYVYGILAGVVGGAIVLFARRK